MRWLAIPVLALLLLPLLFSILVSFTPSRYLELPRGEWTLQWYERFFESPIWTEAFGHLTYAADARMLFERAEPME